MTTDLTQRLKKEGKPQPLQRLAPGLFACSFDLPSDAYLEYAFLDLETNERRRDPHNKRRIWNGVNSYNNFFYMPNAAPTPLVRRKKGVHRSVLTKHQLATWMMSPNGKRAVHIYQSATDGPVPLLVVYDGNDYLRRGKLAIMVDNLIAEKHRRDGSALFQTRLPHLDGHR